MIKYALPVFLFFAMLAPRPGSCQTVRAVVADKSSRAPIPDVFVFLSNSSIGTSTDREGVFELPLQETKEIVLVFSHISYELLTLEITDATLIRDTFFLQPVRVQLQETVIVDRGRPRLRKRRLRAFRDAFLGEGANDKLVEIKNPEVLLFKQEADKLIAEASEPLIIENRELGYTLQFFLKAFHLYDNDDLYYQGNAFFEALEDHPKAQRAYAERRKEIYRKSSRSFFSDLVNGQLDTTVYRIGFSYLNQDGNFTNFTPINTADLIFQSQPGEATYEILIRGFLTVINQDILVEGSLAAPPRNELNSSIKLYSDQKRQPATSYLRSRSDRIIVNRHGKILNPSKIEEYGYWTSLRVGSLLPSDYRPAP